MQVTDRQTPITVNLSLKPYNSSYPIINESSAKNFQTSIKINKNCGRDNICQSDMKMTKIAFFVNKNYEWTKVQNVDLDNLMIKEKEKSLGLSANQHLYKSEKIFMELGTESKLALNLTVKNFKEDAHQASLTFQLPDSIKFIRKNSEKLCYETEEKGQIYCNLGNPFSSNSVQHIFIEFMRREVDVLKDFEVEVVLRTTSRQGSYSVNRMVLPISVRIAASLGLGLSDNTIHYNVPYFDANKYKLYHNSCFPQNSPPTPTKIPKF